MSQLIFATANHNKVREINEMLADAPFHVITMAEMGCHDDIPETQDTIKGNAIQKAEYFYEKYGLDCFAEDSGLEVDALGGEPGVFSARYAGEQRSTFDNNQLLLTNLLNQDKRTARFRTVIALILDGKINTFEGICEGNIGTSPIGMHGFGYDPLFIPQGHKQTFAELGFEIKNNISARGKAFQLLKHFLENR
jgi:XTP/dITP diphosphohydrolase